MKKTIPVFLFIFCTCLIPAAVWGGCDSTPPPPGGGEDNDPPGEVVNLTATPDDEQVTLEWQNPGDSDFAGVKIMFRIDTYPVDHTDGTEVYNDSGESFLHTNLTNGVTCYYSVFTYDTASNYSSGSNESAMPKSPKFGSEVTKILADDGAKDDQFGISVSISGDYMIVGANKNDAGAGNAGAAYIYHWSGFEWTEQQKLFPAEPGSNSSFGYSVSIQGDRAIVGAPWYTVDPGSNGAAFIFKRDGAQWIEEQKLTLTNTSYGDRFGYAVAIYNDRAIVGALALDEVGRNSGAAFLYLWDGNTWIEQQKIIASDLSEREQFGRAVAMYEEYAVVGSYYRPHFSQGAAYVFYWDGINWTEQQKITSSPFGPGYHYGANVAIEGARAVCSAHGNEAAYVFDRALSTWTEEKKLSASDNVKGDSFGFAVDIHGEYIIVGAHEDDDKGGGSGSAYVFYWDGVDWVQVQKLTASDGTASAHFGRSVAISDDFAVVGAYQDDNVNGDEAGAVYIFE